MAPRFNPTTGEWEGLEQTHKKRVTPPPPPRNNIVYNKEESVTRVKRREPARASGSRHKASDIIAEFGLKCRDIYTTDYDNAPGALLAVGVIISGIILFCINTFIFVLTAILLVFDTPQEYILKSAWNVMRGGAWLMRWICYNTICLCCAVVLLIGILI